VIPAGSTAAGGPPPARTPPRGPGLPIPDQEWRATGLEPAVFADPSGRRARAMSGVGLALVSVTLTALAIVVTAVVGFTRLPLPGLPPRAAFVAGPPHHTEHRVLVAGIRAEARIRGITSPAITVPRDIDRPTSVHD